MEHLNITAIYIKLNKDKSLKRLATAEVTFDSCFIIKDIEIHKNKLYEQDMENQNPYFLRYPVNQRGRTIMNPSTNDSRIYLEKLIIDKFLFIKEKYDE